MVLSDQGMEDKLAGLERELERLKAGLELLGATPCSSCGNFYRHSDPGALFSASSGGVESVCYNCIPQWWAQRSPQLSAEDRQRDERLLRHWLVRHHQAVVIQQPEHLPKPETLKLHLVTGCEECDSSGKTDTGKRCHHCDGRGTVWVVIRQPELGLATG